MQTRKLGITVAALVLVLVSGAVAGNASDTEQDPEQELARLESQLAAVTAERDALLAGAGTSSERHARSNATQAQILDIIAEPSAFGTEEQVLDLLDELAVSGAPYGDAAWGISTSWRGGWRNTLFSDVDARIRTWVSWLAEDGSVGGSLWTWSGTAANGEPFDLQGVELSTFDEAGLLDSVMVHYPYESAEVLRRFSEGG